MENTLLPLKVNAITGISSGLLLDFLSKETTPEHLALFVRAADFFRDVGLDEDVEVQCEEQITSLDRPEIDSSNVLEVLQEIHVQELRGFIKSVEIDIAEDLSFSQVLDIAEAVRALEFYEESELILDLLNSDEENAVILADLLELTGQDSFGHYVTAIWDCSSAFMSQLREIHYVSTTQVEHITNPEVARSYQVRLRAYAKFIGTTNLRVINMIRTGMPYGLPLQTYVTRLTDVLASLAPENVAVELYALALICAEHETNVLQLLEPVLDSFSSDVARSSKIRNTLLNVIRRSSNERSTSTS